MAKRWALEITELPYTISEPGFYFITKNLTSPPNKNGITIASHDVTLDLMGYMLYSATSTGEYYGIYTNKYNVEIRNGTVRGFPASGVHGSAYSKGIRVINMRVQSAVLGGNDAYAGIRLDGDSSLVKGCTVIGSGQDGIFGGEGSVITGNSCYDNTGDGIYNYSGSVITGNLCFNNTGDGINSNRGCTIQGNSCYGNGNGITAGYGSSVIGNTCYSNASFGISLYGDSYAGQNTCYDNGIDNMNTPSSCTFGDNHAP